MAGIKITLDVYIQNNLIGKFSLQDNVLSFNYTDSWKKNGYPLSPHLHLNEIISEESLKKYFKNLLPEGGLLEELIQWFRLSRYNTFGLIKELGMDMPGALIVIPEDTPIESQTEFRPVSTEELIERLDNRQDYNLLFWDKKPRLSVAGVQDKLNIFINTQNQIGFGEGSLCSTHILKFETKKLSHLALNEYCSMELARLCGLPVANVELRYFGSHTTLAVERFDRKKTSDDVVKRKHVIDGCQALNLYPEYKYERNLGSGKDVAEIREGASFPKLFAFAKTCLNPIETTQTILDWCLFNLLIFNYDAHGKNISFFLDKNGVHLAPFYDLVNIKLYPKLDSEMAMALGDEFDSNTVNAYQLADFAESCDLPRDLVSKRLQCLLEKMHSAMSFFDSYQYKNKEERSFLKEYQKVITERIEHLSTQVRDIKTIEL